MNTFQYKPSCFLDEHRLEKIRNFLPKVHEIFKKEFLANHFPGLVYGVIVDDQLIENQSFGFIDFERKIPADHRSLFRIASMTKSFTAMAIVKLRDDGKLRLDDPVISYIPELSKTNLLTDDAPILTIRHLLTQDAGMPEDDPWADRQLPIDEHQFLQMLNKGVSLSNPPGTVWEYTNLCFSLLGRIITLVSGRPYEKYIEDEILRPLNMNETFWEYADAPSDRLAHGYRWESDTYKEEALLHHGVYGAMGGLISSIEDFSKYISFHLQAWPARNGPQIGPLCRSSLREMHHPWNFIELKILPDRSSSISVAYAYGLVWTKTMDQGSVTVSHPGGLPGFGSHWIMLPEYGIGLVSFANSTYADMSRINRTIIDLFVVENELKPRQVTVSNFLRQRQQELIGFIVDNEWQLDRIDHANIFAENFFPDQSNELRKQNYFELRKDLGAFKQVGNLVGKINYELISILNSRTETLKFTSVCRQKIHRSFKN